MAKFTVYYVGDDTGKAGPFMTKDAAGDYKNKDSNSIYKLEVDIEDRHMDVAIPSLDGWKDTTGIKDIADLKGSYDEYTKHWRANNANFDGWWKANKSRFLVDYDASIEALRKMMAT